MGDKRLQRKIEELHQGQDPGCIWRHEGGYGPHRAKGCHHRKNGFQASAGRTGMYNKDHRAIADRLGYGKLDQTTKAFAALGGSGSQVESDLKAGSGKRTEAALDKFLAKFRGKFNVRM